MKKAMFLVLFLGLAVLSSAGEIGVPRFSGLMFGDYYSVQSQHNGKLQGLDGLQFRRIYLTLDEDVAENIGARLRFEAASDDFTKPSNTLVPYIKDAWVKYSYADKSGIYLGLIENPAYSWLEKQWGLRSVEKTPLDLQGWVPSREQGIGLDGSLFGNEYFFTAGNGAGESSEGSDIGKRFGLRITRNLGAGFSGLIYGDVASSSKGYFSPDPYAYTVQSFLGWKGSVGRLGILYGRQVQVISNTADEKIKDMVSAYIVAHVAAPVEVFARIDHMLYGSTNKAGIKYLDLATQRGTLAIVGVDWQAAHNLNIQPNVEVSYYQNDAGGSVASEDVIPRLTFYLQF
jgi:hypothetical protein